MTDPERTRLMLTRRKFALGLVFAGAAGVAAARQPSTHVDYLGKRKLEDILPEKIGQWTFVSTSGLVVPPEDQLSRALYSQLLTRVYEGEINSALTVRLAPRYRDSVDAIRSIPIALPNSDPKLSTAS